MEHIETYKHSRGHRRRIMKMRRMGRGRGPRFGPPFAGPERGAMMRGFFAENPDCADKMATYGVSKMRNDGLSNDEIRDHLSHLQARGFVADLDIDSIMN